MTPRETPVVKTGETVRGSFVRVSGGLAVYTACQWAIVAVLAKLGTPELVGQYAFAVALTTPVLMLAQMNLRAVLATDVHETHAFREYRNLRYLLLALGMLVIVGLALFQKTPQEGGHEGGNDRFFVVFLVGLIQAGEWVSDIFQGRMQQQGFTGRTAPSMIARGLLGIAALAVALRLTGNLVTALAWMLVARTAVLFAYDSTYAMRGFHHDGPAPSFAEQRRAQWDLVKKALPLGVVLMLAALFLNTPRYFIAASLGERALGVFSALISLTTAANLIVNSLGQSATTRLARLHSAGDVKGFFRLSMKMVGLAVALGIFGLFCAATIGPWAVSLVYRKEYAQQGSLLVIAMGSASIGFVAALFGYTITAARRFTQQMPLQAACLAATTLAAYLLVPRMGLNGAAISIGIGSLVQTLGEAWILRDVLAEMKRVRG